MVADLWNQLDDSLRAEILSVSDKNVLYELVQSFVNKYGDPSEKEVGRKKQVKPHYLVCASEPCLLMCDALPNGLARHMPLDAPPPLRRMQVSCYYCCWGMHRT